MRRLFVVTACAAALVGTLAVAGTAGPGNAGVPAAASFRLADGSAGCAFDDGVLACRSETMDAAAVLKANGSRSVQDVPVAWDRSTPVLRSSESWWHGEFTCRIDGDLLCSTFDGATISVAGRS